MKFRRDRTTVTTATTATDEGVDRPAAAAVAEVPCVPCGDKTGVRQFTLDTPPVAVADHEVPRIAVGVETEVGEEAVLLEVDGIERAYELNPTAGLIWLTIDGESTTSQIIATLHQETGAPAELIAPDVRATLSTFLSQGLIQLGPVVSPAQI